MAPSLLVIVHCAYAIGLMVVLRNTKDCHDVPVVATLIIPTCLFFTALVSHHLGTVGNVDLITSYLLVGVTHATLRYYQYRATHGQKEPTFGMFMLYMWRSFFWPFSSIKSLLRKGA